MHDIIIIGAGPIGSGAARHASMQGRGVTVIAPHEGERHNHIVWSSHYDQGYEVQSVRKADPCLFFKGNSSWGLIMWLTYIDDKLCIANAKHAEHKKENTRRSV